MSDVTQHCTNEASHTPCPSGYTQWMAWAEKRCKTHSQVKCPGCGLYVIWVPKEADSE